jgi:hypothetical protein
MVVSGLAKTLERLAARDHPNPGAARRLGRRDDPRRHPVTARRQSRASVQPSSGSSRRIEDGHHLAPTLHSRHVLAQLVRPAQHRETCTTSCGQRG